MIKLDASPPRGRQPSQTCALLDPRPSMNASSPPASPERTAEYWDQRVQELRDRRERMRREAQESSNPNRATSPVQANVLDIISSYEGDLRRPPPTAAPTSSPPSTSRSHPTSFEFGFVDRNRADSAHDFSDMPQQFKLSPKTTSTASPSSVNARGLRKEGQTLTNPSPTNPTKTRRWSRTRCPVRPPRPEVSFLDPPTTITSPPPPPPPPRTTNSFPPSTTTHIPRKPVALHHQRSMPLHPVPQSPPSSASSRLSPARPHQPQSMSKVASAPSPTTPTTMMSEALASGAMPRDDAYTLEQTVSVWEDDDDEKIGLVNYIRWTLHSRKLSGEAKEREKSKNASTTRWRKKSGGEGASGSGEVKSRRRDSFKKMLRVFRCGHGGVSEDA